MGLAFALAALGSLAAASIEVDVAREPAGLHVVVVVYRPYGFSAPSYSGVREALQGEARRVYGKEGYVALTSYGSRAVPLVLPGGWDACRVRGAAMFTFASVQWPYWREGQEQTDPADTARWSRREGRILAHEESHAALAKHGDTRVLDRLVDMPPAPCWEIFQGLDEAYATGWAATGVAQDAFDQRGDYRGALDDVPAFWAEVHGERARAVSPRLE